ncbi:MAG TPA: hypothetical protein VN947_21265 [Polyangia bacterium]|nr:hypothetical protein [Polyangia bacterium]
MQDVRDFSLPIVVVLPERRVVTADDQLTTTPFRKANLPGVDLTPAKERPPVARRPLSGTPAPSIAEPAAAAASAFAGGARPLPAPRHAWLPTPAHPQPSKIRARSLLGVPPPPPTRAAPLSDDDERRMLRRTHAWRRIAWAQRMLERFGFAPPDAGAEAGADAGA